MIAGFIKQDTINLLFEGLAGVCTQLRRERESLILCGEKKIMTPPGKNLMFLVSLFPPSQ